MNDTLEKLDSLRDQMTGALIGLARALEGQEISSSAKHAIAQGLAFALPGSMGDPVQLDELILMIREEKKKAAPDCAACKSPCGRTSDYRMEELWEQDGGLREKKFLLLTALCSVGSAAFRMMLVKTPDEEVFRFLCDGLFLLGYAFEENQLDPVLARADTIYLLCKS